MLLYKNHRFFYEVVSFAIPDGYCLDTNYGDGAEDSLDFWTADKSLRIRIAIEKETKGPRAELNYVIRELEECVVLEGPKAVMMNGLAGYQATYDTGSRQYCELRFSVSSHDNCHTELMILFVGSPQLPSKGTMLDITNCIFPTKENS